jgi:hypothetical protein
MLKSSIVLAALVLVAGGCSGGDDPASGSDCLVFVNGNKLCGEDARTYCRTFVMQSENLRDVFACRRIGVRIPDTSEEKRQRAEDAARREEGAEEDVDARVKAAVVGIVGDEPPQIGAYEGGVTLLFRGRVTAAEAVRVCRAVRRVEPDLTVRVGDDRRERSFAGGSCDA